MNQSVTEPAVWDALTEVIDPELGIDVVNLGLIYAVSIGPEGATNIEMTLTSIGCPMAAELETDVLQTVRGLTGVSKVSITWSFDPVWTSDKITEDGRDQLMALGYI